jgi:TetR/AcrR family transcriptional regulator, repressor for uid operon
MASVETAAELSTERRTPQERREVILDAFERCIVRAGFHRTTMQDVAKEAGMSAGNLSRYFVSKDQLVSGLCERDRERFGADFQHVAAADDVMGALVALGRQHFVEEKKERCVQFLEIWAEATRNPEVAKVCSAIDREVHGRLEAIVDAAKAKGQVAQTVDSSALIEVVSALGDGMFMRRALDPTYDAEEGFSRLMAVMNGILSGAIDVAPRAPQAAQNPQSVEN